MWPSKMWTNRLWCRWLIVVDRFFCVCGGGGGVAELGACVSMCSAVLSGDVWGNANAVKRDFPPMRFCETPHFTSNQRCGASCPETLRPSPVALLLTSAAAPPKAQWTSWIQHASLPNPVGLRSFGAPPSATLVLSKLICRFRSQSPSPCSTLLSHNLHSFWRKVSPPTLTP